MSVEIAVVVDEKVVKEQQVEENKIQQVETVDQTMVKVDKNTLIAWAFVFFIFVSIRDFLLSHFKLGKSDTFLFCDFGFKWALFLSYFYCIYIVCIQKRESFYLNSRESVITHVLFWFYLVFPILYFCGPKLFANGIKFLYSPLF